jgi:hypothetical protein
LRKLCWNLQVEPVRYLKGLKVFCQAQGLGPEAAWYEKVLAKLSRKENVSGTVEEIKRA